MIELIVFGGTLTLALLAFRFAELHSVPECVRARVTWFSAHTSVLLTIGATAMIIGIVGLAHSTGGSP
ncbi:hypothetical protein [Kutzneria sp. CA-103260]|uniref:hypothetical protein n=1 Tax=Kutzneria sp. CA-103260 TaxID=2802641 RepID=UPI001BA854E2|nr:hypothetical protein [Kutzneria sp. CA-103260]QUQ66473.1 hypothetical protein JJ691_42010 [Kutzneria sp. CA-103260]